MKNVSGFFKFIGQCKLEFDFRQLLGKRDEGCFFSVGRDWDFDEKDEVTLPLTPPSFGTIYLKKCTSVSHFLELAIFFSPPFTSLETPKLT